MIERATLAVGIPTYNQADYLRETLLSILNQEEAPDRILVCNNHSTDRTANVLEEFAGRLEIIMPPHHLTMMENWNFVAQQFNEDWFALLSSDDIAYPNFTRILKRGIAKDPKAVLVRGAWNQIDMQGNILEHHHLLSVRKVTRPPQTLLENKHGPKGSFAAFAIKRDIWLQAGKFPQELFYVGDWGMWINLAPMGNFIYEDEIISGYRVNTSPSARRKRDPLLWGEHAVVFRDLLPHSAKALGMKDFSWIAKACRTSFLNTLSFISRETPPGDRADYVEHLKAWANLAGESEQLERFGKGEKISHFTWRNFARSTVRPQLQRFKSWIQ